MNAESNTLLEILNSLHHIVHMRLVYSCSVEELYLVIIQSQTYSKGVYVFPVSLPLNLLLYAVIILK